MHGLSEVGLDFPYVQRIIRETGSVGRVTESLIQSSLCMCIHTGAFTCLLVLEYIIVVSHLPGVHEPLVLVSPLLPTLAPLTGRRVDMGLMCC